MVSSTFQIKDVLTVWLSGLADTLNFSSMKVWLYGPPGKNSFLIPTRIEKPYAGLPPMLDTFTSIVTLLPNIELVMSCVPDHTVMVDGVTTRSALMSKTVDTSTFGAVKANWTVVARLSRSLSRTVKFWMRVPNDTWSALRYNATS